MALSLLDGSNTNIDISINSNSYKLVMNYWSADYGRDMTEATTFGSSGNRVRTPGMRQLTGRAEGYLSKGVAYSDPSLTLTSQTAVTFVLTADTSCSVTFTGFITRVHMGLRAAANSEFSIDFESASAITFAWVVA